MSLNIYYLIFYILYRFSWLADKKESRQEVIVQSAYLSFTICIFLIVISIIKLTGLPNSISISKTDDLILGGIMLLAIYLVNGRLLLKENKYVEIARYYDDRFKLKSGTVIFISLFILLGSFFGFLLIMILTKA